MKLESTSALWIQIAVVCGTMLLSSCANSALPNKDAKPNAVVLEISTYAGGNSYPAGDILDFRLYESGRVEYDDYPKQDPSRVTSAL